MSKLRLDEGDPQLVQDVRVVNACVVTFRRGYIHVEIKTPNSNALGYAGYVNVSKKQRAALRKALAR